jgi:hypothetical protein
MAAKQESRILNYALIGIVVVCVGLVFSMVASNVIAELKNSESRQDLVINAETELGNGQSTPAPTLTPNAVMITPTFAYDPSQYIGQ